MPRNKAYYNDWLQSIPPQNAYNSLEHVSDTSFYATNHNGKSAINN